MGVVAGGVSWRRGEEWCGESVAGAAELSSGEAGAAEACWGRGADVGSELGLLESAGGGLWCEFARGDRREVHEYLCGQGECVGRGRASKGFGQVDVTFLSLSLNLKKIELKDESNFRVTVVSINIISEFKTFSIC